MKSKQLLRNSYFYDKERPGVSLEETSGRSALIKEITP